ncbi:hypothetical protein HMPREF1419_01072 [Helicobacter pylori GAM263BFi]|nr:hypothetical protein HMPREF1419_01072 [Helicobacter pylori GAM263BFi]
MIVLKNAQSLFKRVRNSFNNRMQTPQNSRITPLFKETPECFRFRERS